MCETRDLGLKWPFWHTLVFRDQIKIDMRFCVPKGRQKEAGAEGQISVLEKVGSQARV